MASQESLEEALDNTHQVSSQVWQEETLEVASEAASEPAQLEHDQVQEAQVPVRELVDTRALMEVTQVEAHSAVNFTVLLSTATPLASGLILVMATSPLAANMATD